MNKKENRLNLDQLRELLETTHRFPGGYTIKVIGRADDDFADRVVAVARERLGRPGDVQTTCRATPHGRHVSVTVQLSVITADEVLVVYEALQAVQGVTMLL